MVNSRQVFRAMDTGETIGLISNVGVIAGTIFLAVEVKQEIKLLAASAVLLRRYWPVASWYTPVMWC